MNQRLNQGRLVHTFKVMFVNKEFNVVVDFILIRQQHNPITDSVWSHDTGVVWKALARCWPHIRSYKQQVQLIGLILSTLISEQLQCWVRE